MRNDNQITADTCEGVEGRAPTGGGLGAESVFNLTPAASLASDLDRVSQTHTGPYVRRSVSFLGDASQYTVMC